MRQNVMTHRLSNREKVLLLVLVLVLLVGLYFYVVHYPITNRLDEIELERDDLLVSQAVADTRLQTYNDMKAELEEIFAMPEDEITVMPAYSNRETLLLYFDKIFAGTSQVLNFDDERETDGIVERTVRFSFNADSYAKARQVLTDLTVGSGYRCLLDSLTVSPVEGNIEAGALRISGTITFYEYKAG